MGLTYNTWQTMFAAWKNTDKLRRGVSHVIFTKLLRKWTAKQLAEIHRAPETHVIEGEIIGRNELRALATSAIEIEHIEHSWELAGGHYYNVHPEMVAKLATTNLTSVPASMIEMPDNKQFCLICFDRSPQPLLMYDPGTAYASQITAMLCYKMAASDRHPHGSLALLIGTTFHNEVRRKLTARSTPYEFAGAISTAVIDCDPELSVAEAIHKTLEKTVVSFNRPKEENVSTYEWMSTCLRVIVTIGFLRNSSPELFEYDVLARYRDEYRRASDTRRKELEKLSRAAKKPGWNFGTSELFLTDNVPIRGSSDGDGLRELTWAHIRKGHPHAVRYGPNRSFVKIKWFRAVAVRPDLPFKAQ